MRISLASLSLVSAETSNPRYVWRFEEDYVRGVILKKCALTRDPDLVISGNASLFADSRENDETWNEYLHTDAECVSLLPNTAYTIRLRYRAIEPLGGKAFYFLLRSRKTFTKSEGDSYRVIWEEWDHEVHSKCFVLKTENASDYYLLLGIQGKGAIVIDDLELFHGAPAPSGRLVKRAYPHGEKFARWRKSAYARGVAVCMETVQNVLDPGGWRKWDGEYRDYLVELNPDMVAYLKNDVVQRLGFFYTSASMEYQELYEFDAKKHNIPWEEMVDRYRHAGMAIDIDGEPRMDPTWAAGGYYTCQAGRDWRNYYLEDLGRAVHRWHGLNQDNIGCVGVFKGEGAYCNGCQRRFKEYLKEAYSGETLRSWGIENLDSFDIREFLLEHSLYGRDALESPVVREYIKSYNLGQLEAWIDVGRHVREWTEGRDPFPIYGNIIGAMRPIPYAVLLCPWVDVISMEHWWPSADFYMPPRFHCAAWGYKVAWAATPYPKPVLILNALEQQGAALFKTTTELTFAEGLANGGNRVYSPGANIPRYEGKHPLALPEIRALHEHYAPFVRDHRGLFFGRKSANRAAVVYSIPTHVFHRFPAIPDLLEIHEYRRFAAACLMMETGSIPYDVLVLPHPELNPELEWREKLEGYALVVFPGVTAIAREQVAAFEEFLERGGHILAFAPFAERDENYNPIDDLFGARDHNQYLEVPAWDQELGTDLWYRRENQPCRRSILEALEKVLPPGERPVRGAIPKETSVNLWEDEGGSFFSLHLVNYAWDVEQDESTAIENLRLEIDVPGRYLDHDPVLIRPEHKKPVALEEGREGNSVWIEIPQFRVYAIVVWGDAMAIEAKTEYATAMNLGLRMHAMRQELPEAWWKVLHDAWVLGDRAAVCRYMSDWQQIVTKVEQAYLAEGE